MSNSMKLIVFLISIFAFFIFNDLTKAILNVLRQSSPSTMLAYIQAAVPALGFIFILYLQSFVRNYYTKKNMSDAKVLLVYPIAPFKIFERLVVYILPATIVVSPIFKTKQFTSINWAMLMYLALFIIIFEVLFYMSYMSMRILVTDKGIAVTGTDLRFEIPININYADSSGFYPFHRINNYKFLNDKLVIYNSFNTGTITIKGTYGELNQIKALFLANGIKEIKAKI